MQRDRGHIVPTLRHLDTRRALYLNVLDHAGSVAFLGRIVALLRGRMLTQVFTHEPGGEPDRAGMTMIAAGAMWIAVEWLRAPDPRATAEDMAATIASTVTAAIRGTTGRTVPA